MAENLICVGNRVFTKEGRDNFDRIFGCGIDAGADEEVVLMKKGVGKRWVTPEEVETWIRKGWRKA